MGLVSDARDLDKREFSVESAMVAPVITKFSGDLDGISSNAVTIAKFWLWR